MQTTDFVFIQKAHVSKLSIHYQG